MGGINIGVMCYVGEVVKGYIVMLCGVQVLKDEELQLYLIGIVIWGIVDYRIDLIDSKVSVQNLLFFCLCFKMFMGMKLKLFIQGVVMYYMIFSLLLQGVCFDNNYLYFILVDDGMVGKYGGEILFCVSL